MDWTSSSSNCMWMKCVLTAGRSRASTHRPRHPVILSPDIPIEEDLGPSYDPKHFYLAKLGDVIFNAMMSVKYSDFRATRISREFSGVAGQGYSSVCLCHHQARNFCRIELVQPNTIVAIFTLCGDDQDMSNFDINWRVLPCDNVP